jgi:cyclic pyranopterin phosphate synthase
MAQALKAAGLGRVTISLDSLKDDVFGRINDVGYPVAKVLDAVAHAEDAGLTPIKINMVVKRGLNDEEILPMAERFRGTGHILRYIEFMDVGTTNGWSMQDVVPAAEILDIIRARYPLEPIAPHTPGEVARRYRYRDGQGEIGIIASVTQPFCRGCTRARLSPEGRLYTCLFGSDGLDLRHLVRSGASDEEIIGHIQSAWTTRDDRYSEERTQSTHRAHKIEMFRIGG